MVSPFDKKARWKKWWKGHLDCKDNKMGYSKRNTAVSSDWLTDGRIADQNNLYNKTFDNIKFKNWTTKPNSKILMSNLEVYQYLIFDGLVRSFTIGSRNNDYCLNGYGFDWMNQFDWLINNGIFSFSRSNLDSDKYDPKTKG